MNMGLVCLIVLLLQSVSLFATQSRCADGRIEFVVYVVNGKSVYSTKEKDDEIGVVNAYNLKGGSVTVVADVVAVAPESFELNLSSCAYPWKDWPEYSRSLTVPSVLETKIGQVLAVRNVSVPGSEKYNDYNNRYNWLLSYYQGLP